MKKRNFIIAIVLALFLLVALINTNIFWNTLNPVFYNDLLNEYGEIYQIDPLLVAAFIRVESKFSPYARSQVGAIGLMQIMPVTGKEIATKLRIDNFQPRDLYVPEINIEIGFYYLNELKKEFGDDQVAILASYNAGRTNVRYWMGKDTKLTVAKIPFRETRNFTRSVLSTYRHLQYLRQIKNLVTIRRHDLN